MNIIIYVLAVVIILYVICYHHTITNIERFWIDENNVINNVTNTTENNDVVNNVLDKLQIIKDKLPNTGDIMQHDLMGTNKFIPLVSSHFNTLNRTQSDSFNEIHNKQQNTVTSLKQQITNFRDKLEMESGRDFKSILSITSNQNGQPLSVIPISNDKHLVLVNNKCLSSNSVDNYDITQCNYLDSKQHFKLNPVYHDIDYNINLAPSVPKIGGGMDKDKKNIKYPFVLVKSEASGNCLANKDSQLYISKCEADENQRWFGSTSLYKCSAPK
jgi:hypothetical protein